MPMRFPGYSGGKAGEKTVGAYSPPKKKRKAPEGPKTMPKPPSEVMKEREASEGQVELTPSQKLRREVLDVLHEGTSQTRPTTKFGAALKGAVSGARVGDAIGEAFQRYQDRKKKKKLGETAFGSLQEGKK